MRSLILALALLVAAPAVNAQVVAPDKCWNGRNPSKYTKNTSLWRTLTTTPAGTTLTTRNPRVGRSGGTEWATAVSMPIADSLANRELTAADVKITFKAVSGAPAVNVVSYWYSGYQWDGRKGSIETTPAAELLFALQTPGYVYGGGVFSTKGPHVMMADDLAFDADNIAWDEELDWLSFFLAPAGPGYGDLKQVTLTLYHCPLSDLR